MRIDELYAYCLSKPGAWDDTPFGPDTLVFKVRKKMFGIVALEREPVGIGLKCDPERGRDLRERYDGVTTGPYLNGKHWNLVLLRSDVPSDVVRALVDHSYTLVVAGMTRKERAALDADVASGARGDLE
jgi:predicted DNA-binding protein (MmcQ/YjbR family)